MQDYVVSYPAELDSKINEIAIKIQSLWIKGDFSAAEKLLKQQYELILTYERKLPEGKRHHKGAPLHNWGIAILLQRDPHRVQEGYLKILLAFIEDLLDFDNTDQVITAPAYVTLSNSPFTSIALIKKIISEVQRRKRDKNIPKNPRDVLTPPLRDEAESDIEKGKTNKDKVVFVVRGRNDKATDAMCEFLRSIGLYPLLFEEAVIQSGKTSPYIGEVLETAFSLAQAVIVLMTPDDVGCLCENLRRINDPIHETQPTPQARINVYFEAGWALGGSHRDNTVLVELGNLRPFSEISGRHKVLLSNSTAKRKDLIGRLKNAGCSVDLTQDSWKHAGDFDSAVGADDSKFEHVEARLFYPPDVSWEKNERSPHKNNPRLKLVLVTDLKKAYHVGNYAWNLILMGKITWFSDDEQDLKKWCANEGYEYIPENATEKKLMEPFFDAKIIDRRKHYRQGENVLFETHYRGELKNGFFDNEIIGPGKFKAWSWALDTLENSLPDIAGKLDGYVNHLSKWSWGIPMHAPLGKYTINMRVYNHYGVNKRPIINEKMEELTVVS